MLNRTRQGTHYYETTRSLSQIYHGNHRIQPCAVSHSLKLSSFLISNQWSRQPMSRSTNLRKAEIFISIRSKVMRQTLTVYIYQISQCQSGDHIRIPLKLSGFIEFFALIILVIKLSQFEPVFLKIQVKYFFDIFLHFLQKIKSIFSKKSMIIDHQSFEF